jgi:hypothetical protein
MARRPLSGKAPADQSARSALSLRTCRYCTVKLIMFSCPETL